MNETHVNGHTVRAPGDEGAAPHDSNGASVRHHDESVVLPVAPPGPTPRPTTAPSSVDRVRAAVKRAKAAQYEWQLQPFSERAKALTRAAQEMLRRRGEVIALAREEMGKVDVEGLFNEALGPLDNVKSWIQIVRRATRRQHVRLNPISFPRKHAYVDLVPRGVIGVIAPWNFPVAGLYRPTIPALLTGNGLVVKPSEFTPKTSAWLIERLTAELP